MKRFIKIYGLHIGILIGGPIILCLFYRVLDNFFPKLLNTYPSLVTFLVGLIAFFLYTKQQQDTKKEIATIIVNEIRYAEEKIKEIKKDLNRLDHNFFPELLLPQNTWVKYQHLFIKDLDPIDEYPTVQNFYSNCSIIDSAFKFISPTSVFVQKSDALLNGVSHIAEKLVMEGGVKNKEELKEVFEGRADIFASLFAENNSFFTGHVPKIEITKRLERIDPIMNTPVGDKLKKIAGL